MFQLCKSLLLMCCMLRWVCVWGSNSDNQTKQKKMTWKEIIVVLILKKSLNIFIIKNNPFLWLHQFSLLSDANQFYKRIDNLWLWWPHSSRCIYIDQEKILIFAHDEWTWTLKGEKNGKPFPLHSYLRLRFFGLGRRTFFHSVDWKRTFCPQPKIIIWPESLFFSAQLEGVGMPWKRGVFSTHHQMG